MPFMVRYKTQPWCRLSCRVNLGKRKNERIVWDRSTKVHLVHRVSQPC